MRCIMRIYVTYNEMYYEDVLYMRMNVTYEDVLCMMMYVMYNEDVC